MEKILLRVMENKTQGRIHKESGALLAYFGEGIASFLFTWKTLPAIQISRVGNLNSRLPISWLTHVVYRIILLES